MRRPAWILLVLSLALSGGAWSAAEWDLGDLLWGITVLQESPHPLTPSQRQRCRVAVRRVVEASERVRSFPDRAAKVLTAEQLDFLEARRKRGVLSRVPEGLPPAGPGRDPLVQHVRELLRARAEEP